MEEPARDSVTAEEHVKIVPAIQDHCEDEEKGMSRTFPSTHLLPEHVSVSSHATSHTCNQNEVRRLSQKNL